MRAGGRAVLSNLRNNLRWSDQNLRIARSFFASRLNFRFDRNAETVTVTLPVLPALAATWAAGPCGDLTYVVGAGGGPLKKESFGNAFRKACNAAGVPGSAHGIRKLAATRAAEKGATEHELDAIFGWRGGAMSREYTGKPTARACRCRPCTSSRTIRQHLFPHLMMWCGPQRGNSNEINAKFWKWCGREDSNLHGLPR